mmetsp:Transcript_46323/g.90434  ORF Transcript_46323/g.90434 Transcript_46323/m.90434 type:complete len:259 (-) Transcript_46323:88-864(-)
MVEIDLFKTTTAISTAFTLAGNSGVSPFLTLFLIGSIEKADPTLLDMEATTEKLLASWPSLSILSIVTVLEFVGKCVPVVDELIDSVEVFVIPIISVFASLSAMGMFSVDDTQDTDVTVNDDQRNLSIASDGLIFVKVVVIIIGMGMALGIHLFKMLVRLAGIGWCTGCITVIEVFTVVTSIYCAIYIKGVSIFVATIMIFITCYTLKRKCFDKNTPDTASRSLLPLEEPFEEAIGQNEGPLKEASDKIEESKDLATA